MVAHLSDDDIWNLRRGGHDPQKVYAAYDQAVNARASGETLDRFATPDEAGRALLMRAGQAGGLTARGWTRTLRLARTIADLASSERITPDHIGEAIQYRTLDRRLWV
jgi:magnesium chelatase family protein